MEHDMIKIWLAAREMSEQALILYHTHKDAPQYRHRLDKLHDEFRLLAVRMGYAVREMQEEGA
jgi:hypothetical protein